MQKQFDIVERSYKFSKAVVLFIKENDFKRMYYPIVDQLLRSATSVGANIIEAKSGNSRKNLINYFSIALRSANETRYWLRLVHEIFGINGQEMDDLLKECNELSKILGKSILTLKKNDAMLKSESKNENAAGAHF